MDNAIITPAQLQQYGYRADGIHAIVAKSLRDASAVDRVIITNANPFLCAAVVLYNDGSREKLVVRRCTQGGATNYIDYRWKRFDLAPLSQFFDTQVFSVQPDCVIFGARESLNDHEMDAYALHRDKTLRKLGYKVPVESDVCVLSYEIEKYNHSWRVADECHVQWISKEDGTVHALVSIAGGNTHADIAPKFQSIRDDIVAAALRAISKVYL